MPDTLEREKSVFERLRQPRVVIPTALVSALAAVGGLKLIDRGAAAPVRDTRAPREVTFRNADDIPYDDPEAETQRQAEKGNTTVQPQFSCEGLANCRQVGAFVVTQGHCESGSNCQMVTTTTDKKYVIEFDNSARQHCTVITDDHYAPLQMECS